MQEKIIKKELSRLFHNKLFSGSILGLSLMLMVIDNFLKMDILVGGWHMVLYVALITPLAYLVWKKELKNPYVKWVMPLFLVFMIDMFSYSNDMVQFTLPVIFYLLLGTLYATSMHKVHSLYQTFLPRISLFGGVEYLTQFFEGLFKERSDKQLYRRVGVAVLITVPFLLVFVSLLFSADKNFENFLSGLIDFNFGFDIKYLFTVPFYSFAYLLFFTMTLSNVKNRVTSTEKSSFDMLIVGIFLGMINLLFLMFIAMQLPFLFGEPHLPNGYSLAEFAREGFFQLMMVMGLVIVIFMFIMRRYKGEKLSLVLLSALLLETVVMGVVSLKKMYLYQSIKGATVLRYYVEWFDYFLIAVLLLGVLFLIRKLAFKKLLDWVVILGLLSFTLIVSLNVDAMVASHNIEKFKDTPKDLDENAIERLSIDALPAIQGSDLKIIYGGYGHTYKRDCSHFASYHYGYCSTLNKYGEKQFTKYEYNSYYEDIDNIPMPVRVKNQPVSTIYMKCAGCHGVKGEKPALGKSALIGGENNLVIAQKLFAYKKGELNLYGMGNLMKGQVSSLSSKDIKDLAFYIEMMGKENNESK